MVRMITLAISILVGVLTIVIAGLFTVTGTLAEVERAQTAGLAATSSIAAQQGVVQPQVDHEVLSAVSGNAGLVARTRKVEQPASGREPSKAAGNRTVVAARAPAVHAGKPTTGARVVYVPQF